MLQKLCQSIIRMRRGTKNLCSADMSFCGHVVQGNGERQAAPTLDGIRPDHVARYEFAARLIPRRGRVLDMACGVGYGAYIMSRSRRCAEILAVDRSAQAIEYAKQCYSSSKIAYRLDDCLTTPLEPESYDLAVCFETIEHIQQPEQLLGRFCAALRPHGRLVLSTPNQAALPYSAAAFPFHVRHYRPAELEDLIGRSGLSIQEAYSQPSLKTKRIVSGWEGCFNIAVCAKGRP